jgi:hypothetical protein
MTRDYSYEERLAAALQFTERLSKPRSTHTVGEQCSARQSNGIRCVLAVGHAPVVYENSRSDNPDGHNYGELDSLTMRVSEYSAAEQKLPTAGVGPVIQDLVAQDIQERLRVGIERYGQPLRAFNGRDALKDLYEELLDAVVYTRQVMMERQLMIDDEPRTLERELAAVLNKYGVESESNTPDFILAEYVRNTLTAFNRATHERERWYGVAMTPGAHVPLAEDDVNVPPAGSC